MAAGLVITTEGGIISVIVFSSLSTKTVTGIKLVVLPLVSFTVAAIKWFTSSSASFVFQVNSYGVTESTKGFVPSITNSTCSTFSLSKASIWIVMTPETIAAIGG